MSSRDLTSEEHAEKMAGIIQKGGRMFCHKDDEHLFLNKAIPYTVDQHGVIERGCFIACADTNLAPDLDAMVEASVNYLEDVAKGKARIEWSGPY